jgi:hypothetical protein
MQLNKRGLRGGNAQTSEKSIVHLQDTIRYNTQYAESPDPQLHVRIFITGTEFSLTGDLDFVNMRRIAYWRGDRHVVTWRIDVYGETIRLDTMPSSDGQEDWDGMVEAPLAECRR